MKNEYKIILFLLSLYFVFFLFSKIGENSNVKILVQKIENEYSGVIINKYNPREWMDELTAIEVRNSNGEIEDFPMRSEIMDYIEVGDKIIKLKDENICYIIKPTGEQKKFFYVRISMNARNHRTFPKEWKNKWLESSEWDEDEK